jgi:putative ABC transport system permease protein
MLWVGAFADSLRNGPAERARPAVSWRRSGNWGRDVELVSRRLMRAPIFAATTIGTLTIGLGMFAVVYTATQRILIDPMSYRDPGNLYYIWRDYGPIVDLKRGALGGTDIAELQKTNAVIRLRRPPEFFPQMKDAIAFQDRVHNALAAIPGVTGASAATALPLTATTSQTMINIPGAPGNTGDAERDAVLTDIIGVAANYVEVMGMRLLAGRTFTELRPNGVAEAMIDTVLARRFFPDGNAVAAKIPLGERSLPIIGVVNQARLYDVHADGRPQILVRVEDFGVRPLSFVMRTTREPRSLLPDVQAVVRRMDPRVPVADARSMDEIVDQALSQQRTSAALISAFAIGALLLAAMGLYGVVSGSVTRRRHELAVRLALGADPGRVVRLMLKEGAVLVMMGLAIGAPGIYIAGGLIRSVLVGVSPSDPLTLFGVALGLLLVTMATCYVPARRAFGIEPAKLLRQE